VWPREEGSRGGGVQWGPLGDERRRSVWWGFRDWVVGVGEAVISASFLPYNSLFPNFITKQRHNKILY